MHWTEEQFWAPSNSRASGICIAINTGSGLEPIPLYCSGLNEGLKSA